MRFLHNHILHDHTLRGVCRDCCLVGLLALPLLAGCGGGGGNGNSGGGTTTTGTNSAGTSTMGTNSAGTNTGTQPPLTASVMTATGLTATLSESSSTVAVNGTLTYTLTLANNTPAAIPIHAISASPTAPSAGIIVKNSAGAIIFAPLPGPAPVANASLAPGQSLTTTVVATNFTTAGTYSTTATFSDDTSTAATVGPLNVTAQ